MGITLVRVKVKKENIDQFIEATIENHENTRSKEPGNVRFDLLQNDHDPSMFTIYEVFESDQAVMKHKETEHYLKWRKTVADWMEIPREGVKHHEIVPIQRSQW